MLPLALGFLPCQVTVDMGTFPDRLEASAICRVEVAADAPALWLEEGILLDEVLAENGGLSVFPVAGEPRGGLVPWRLPGLPRGVWRLRLDYAGPGWTQGPAPRLAPGAAPQGDASACVALSFQGAPAGVTALLARGDGVLCDPGQAVVAGRWAAWTAGESQVSVLRAVPREPHPDWGITVGGLLRAGAEALSLPVPPVRVAGAGTWGAEPGVVWVPDPALDAPPDPIKLAPLITAQWLPVGQEAAGHPLGRYILPYVGGPASPASRRTADRAALARQAAAGDTPDRLLTATARADAAAAHGWTDCGEEAWPAAEVASAEVTRIRRGYETRVAIDFRGLCPTYFEIEVTGSGDTERGGIVLESGRSTILVQTAWQPRTLTVDPDVRFPGALGRDLATPILADARRFEEWLQPATLAGALGPGGVSWPEPGVVVLPDGTTAAWDEDAALYLAGSGGAWAVTPVEGAPSSPPTGAWSGHGWVLVAAGRPVRWGTRPGGAPTRLPAPTDFLDLG